jgi:uncharacterized protein (UPF0371 family)
MRIYFYRLCLKKFTRFGISAQISELFNLLKFRSSYTDCAVSTIVLKVFFDPIQSLKVRSLDQKYDRVSAIPRRIATHITIAPTPRIRETPVSGPCNLYSSLTNSWVIVFTSVSNNWRTLATPA